MWRVLADAKSQSSLQENSRGILFNTHRINKQIGYVWRDEKLVVGYVTTAVEVSCKNLGF